MMNLLEQFGSIKTFIFDVDGVLTPGDLLVTEKGELLRRMNVKDGYALKKAIKKGYQVVIITGGNSEGVSLRLKGLGIQTIYTRSHDKIVDFRAFLESNPDVDPLTCLYMGDDVPDLPVLNAVGMPTAPKDAIPECLSMAAYVSPFNGGAGCVRDVIEKVLKLNGDWPNPLANE